MNLIYNRFVLCINCVLFLIYRIIIRSYIANMRSLLTLSSTLTMSSVISCGASGSSMCSIVYISMTLWLRTFCFTQLVPFHWLVFSSLSHITFFFHPHTCFPSSRHGIIEGHMLNITARLLRLSPFKTEVILLPHQVYNFQGHTLSFRKMSRRVQAASPSPV